MVTRLFKLFEDLRSSYWFLPSIMVLASLLVLGLLVWIDARWPIDPGGSFGWLCHGTQAGARDLLGAIAGSMVTVAGVTFSVTIVAVSHASTQLGPRLLTNFLGDLGNQVTLGTFIATFLYALLLMRVVDGEGTQTEGVTFVPHLAITFALVMTLASTINLIYFLHHVPASIHTSNVVATLGRALNRQVRAAFPESIGAGDSDPAPYALDRPATPVLAETAGYLQYVDVEGLADVAEGIGGRVHLVHRAGDFVAVREPLAWLVGDGAVDDAVAARVRACFAPSARRTPARDLAFLVDELCEIATRALSTGINDPYTAMSCLDWLFGAFGQLHDRAPRPSVRRDAEGRVRVVMPELSFASLLTHAMDQLCAHFARDRTAALHLQRRLGRLMLACGPAAQRGLILEQARRLAQATADTLSAPDHTLLMQQDAALARFAEREAGPAAVLDCAWLARG